MENQLLISMLGSSAMQKGREGAKEASATDSRGFRNCLEEATSDSQETETDLISAKESKEEIKERQKAEQADAQAQAKAAQAKLAQNPKAMSGKAFLYDMIYRNPDTLNMAEKQALKLDTAQKNARLNPNHKAGQNLNSTPTLAQAPGKEASQLKAQTFEALLTKEGKGKEDSSKLGTVEANQAASAANKGQGAENAASSSLKEAGQVERSQQTQQLTQAQKRQQVIDQIVTHMEIRNFANKDELQLRLNPEYLGELKIKLTQTKDGELSAQFITDSEETREVLTESRNQLREHIEGKGMRLRQIEVEMVDSLA